MINFLGKISLFALYLAAATPLFAQSAFENEQGKFGYMNEMDKIILPAQYDGVVRVEMGMHTLIFFVYLLDFFVHFLDLCKFFLNYFLSI